MDSKTSPPASDRVSDNAASVKAHPVYNAEMDTSAVDERKLMRKLDLALIPWLSFLYLLSFLVRLFGTIRDGSHSENPIGSYEYWKVSQLS